MFQGQGRRKSSQKKAEPIKPHVKSGDTVMVICGKDKGKTGLVKKVMAEEHRVIVEGVKLVKKAVKPNLQLGQKGGFIEMEAPIHLSNVMFYDIKANKPTRLKKSIIKTAAGKTQKVRVSVKSGEQIDG